MICIGCMRQLHTCGAPHAAQAVRSVDRLRYLAVGELVYHCGICGTGMNRTASGWQLPGSLSGTENGAAAP